MGEEEGGGAEWEVGWRAGEWRIVEIRADVALYRGGKVEVEVENESYLSVFSV